MFSFFQFANRSLVNLEMDLASKEIEISSGFDRKSPDKNVLPANHTGNESYCESQDLITSGNHTGNEFNCISRDLIANGNQTGNEVNLMPADLIANGNQNRKEAYWMPLDLITSRDQIRNKSKDEKTSNKSIKGHQLIVVFLGQFKKWPALRTKFSPAACHDGSNSQVLSAPPSINPNDDLYNDTHVGDGDHKLVIPANPILKEWLESSGRTTLNYSYTQDKAMCPKDLLDAGYWILNDGFDYNENLTSSFKDPLKDGTIVKNVALKIRKGEIAVNKSVMCPVRSNKWDPVSVDSTFLIFLCKLS